MHRVAIADTRPGSVLGASVFNEMGRPLIRAGVALTPAALKQVVARGYVRLVLLEKDESLTPEFIPPETRAELTKALTPAVAYLLETWRSHTAPRPDDARHLDRDLRRAVAAFVREARSETTLTLPGPVRRGPAQWLDDAVNAAAVAVYLGSRFALDESTLERLAYGVLLRDVAMLALPPELVDTPGELSADAQAVMREHPKHAYEALSALQWMDETARLVVLQHHERHNGSGYPYGIKGLHNIKRTLHEALDEDLTLLASEIAAVADVFNALTVDRAHRPCRPPSLVRHMLQTMMGVTLNREIVTVLLERWRPPSEGESSEDARVAKAS